LTQATLAVLVLAAAPDLAALDAYVARAVKDWRVPGLSIAVVEHERVAFLKGYGTRSLEAGGGVSASTLFAIGSTTKAMTAASIGMLVDEGRLDWDDPVVKHLPGLRLADPYVTRELSVRDLLTHRAGVPNTDYLWYRSGLDSREILARLALVPRESSLRSRFRYQNVMYHAAGELIGVVSGKPWAEFVRERLFDPLRMPRTAATFAEAAGRDDVATPHFEHAGEIRSIRNAPVDAIPAAGAVWSSAEEMARWLRFLLGDGTLEGRRLLSEKSLGELFTPQTTIRPDAFYPSAGLTRPHFTTYGLGWFQQDYAGRKLDFHTGSIDGMVAICGLVRDERLGVCVLANLDHAELRHALMLRVLDVFGTGAGAGRDWSAELRALYAERRLKADDDEARLRAGRRPGTRPSLDTAEYAGAYSDPLFGRVEVRAEAGALRLSASAELVGRLSHWHHDTFRVDWELSWLDPAWVRFEVDARGRPARLWLGGLDAGESELMRFAREDVAR
jgi:CubicO group peptidase (beta-lactamase class C family)